MASSDVNTSASGSMKQSGGHAGFERRVAWLEEDVAVLHRRLRDECVEGSGGAGNGNGDQGLRALVARLDGELVAERHLREAMEARMSSLEDAICGERKDREEQLRNFSDELEMTMRGLIGRIDEGLSAGALAMRERTEQTEVRLRTLIKRVDEGLTLGAAALQDTLSGTILSDSAQSSKASSQAEQEAPARPLAPAPLHLGLVSPSLPSRPYTGASPLRSSPPAATMPTYGSRGGSAILPVQAAASEKSDQLIQSWDELRQENLRLRQQREQLHRQIPPAKLQAYGRIADFPPRSVLPHGTRTPGARPPGQRLS